jgi:hypothetical protein
MISFNKVLIIKKCEFNINKYSLNYEKKERKLKLDGKNNKIE